MHTHAVSQRGICAASHTPVHTCAAQSFGANSLLQHDVSKWVWLHFLHKQRSYHPQKGEVPKMPPIAAHTPAEVLMRQHMPMQILGFAHDGTVVQLLRVACMDLRTVTAQPELLAAAVRHAV